ncbi:MAG: hypothetical protein AVDCRST_MAG53-410, partial [uncultured Solirubrobacteraceae bacterium]
CPSHRSPRSCAGRKRAPTGACAAWPGTRRWSSCCRASVSRWISSARPIRSSWTTSRTGRLPRT